MLRAVLFRGNPGLMRELALFAGGGGGILGSKLLGWDTVCAVEIDPFARSVLLARQRDGALSCFPIWDDVRTFDGALWRERVDVISGGFPCQDISSAGKRAGLDGSRSGLWFEFARIIGEVRPRFAFIENSPRLVSNGLDRVLGSLSGMGYNARWGILGARHVGAPHRRDRVWILAHTDNEGQRAQSEHVEMASASEDVCDDHGQPLRSKPFPKREGEAIGRTGAWDEIPNLARVDDGLARRVDRIRATGNGQVPAVARLAWEILSDGLL